MARRTNLRHARILIALLLLYVGSGFLVPPKPYRGDGGSRTYDVTVSAQTPPKQAVFETSAGTFIIDLTPATGGTALGYSRQFIAIGTYSDGTTKRVKSVPMLMPPTSTMPIELRATAPAPVTSVSGK